LDTSHEARSHDSQIGRDACPVCGGSSVFTRDILGWGHWRFCEECTLLFASPLWDGTNPADLFNNAYLGEENIAGMQDFAERLDQRDAVLKDPTLWFWTPAYEKAMAWIGEVVTRGGTILDLGCGPGYVLHAL